MGNTSSTSGRRRTYSDYQYQQSSGRPTSTRSRYQTMGNTSWTSRTWGPYSDYQYQQGLGRPTPTYSRHTGAELGSYTHNSQAGSVYIGRTRLAEQFPYIYPMSKITVPALGKVLIAECGNEGQHPYLSEEGKTTLAFLRAAISFVPLALDAGADMQNASFLFAQAGIEFAIVAGKGDWEFFFYPNCRGEIFGHCVRRPWLRYIWDGVKSTVRRVGSFLLPSLGRSLIALVAA